MEVKDSNKDVPLFPCFSENIVSVHQLKKMTATHKLINKQVRLGTPVSYFKHIIFKVRYAILIREKKSIDDFFFIIVITKCYTSCAQTLTTDEKNKNFLKSCTVYSLYKATWRIPKLILKACTTILVF